MTKNVSRCIYNVDHKTKLWNNNFVCLKIEMTEIIQAITIMTRQFTKKPDAIFYTWLWTFTIFVTSGGVRLSFRYSGMEWQSMYVNTQNVSKYLQYLGNCQERTGTLRKKKKQNRSPTTTKYSHPPKHLNFLQYWLETGSETKLNFS